jgi:UDP-N-acetyl-D-glucosamine dehydrogenase
VRVAIIGQGYVGKALGSAASIAGHQVIGIENDPVKLKELSSALTYEVAGDYSKASSSSIMVIAVPTPLDEKREPDLSFIRSACQSLKAVLDSPVLIINESTSFPGTLRNVIAPILGSNHLYASAPERIDPANKIWGIENTPRLVSGLSDEATTKAIEFYKSFCKEVIPVSSPEVAEAAKLFENTFRQVNIALVNEFAQISEALGISTVETIKAASSKPYGFMPFMPSIGVGGHCIPVDPSYLSFVARQAGVDASFIDLANKVNALMPEYIAARIEKLLGGKLAGKKLQIAGISYKADVSDTRESPALSLMAKLRELGADVSWHDELVGAFNGEKSRKLEAVDLGIIATAHSGVDYSPWKDSESMVIDLSTTPNTGWQKFL